MTISVNPYETTFGKLYNPKPTVELIRSHLGRGYDWMKTNDYNNVIYLMPNGIVTKFDHPLLIPTATNGLVYVAVDMTPYVKARQEGGFAVSNDALFTLQHYRAGLTSDLQMRGPIALRSMHPGVVRTYCELLASSISQSYSLNAEEVLGLKCLAGWMHRSMLSQETTVDEIEYHAIISKLSRDLNIPASLFMKYVDHDMIRDIDHFIEVVKEKLTSPSIQNLNIGVLTTAVSRSMTSMGWIGLRHDDILAISLEHIPTFVALLATCLGQPMFRNAGLTRMITRNFRNDKDQFIMTVNNIVGPRMI